MTDTPDPIAEAVPTTEPNPPAAQTRASPVLPVLGGIVAAVLGFGLAQVVPDGWPTGAATSVEADLAAQATKIAALEATVAQLSGPSEPVVDQELAARVSALEAAGATAAQPDIEPVLARIAELETRLAALAAMPQAAGTLDQTELANLQAAVTDLQTNGIPAAALSAAATAVDEKLADVDAKIATIRAEAEAIATSTANRAATSQLLAALDTGAPYIAALAGLSGVAVPEVIAANAETGLPSLQSLRESFPDAARQALDAAFRADAGQGWTERLTTFLRGQTGARSLSPREGTDPDAVLSRAEAALAAADLPAALAELQTLPPEALSAMSDWLARATVRQDATVALQDLLAKAEM
jgi:hypothetical protein